MIYENDKYTIEIDKEKDKIEVKPPGQFFDAVMILQYLKGKIAYTNLDSELRKEVATIFVKDLRC